MSIPFYQINAKSSHQILVEEFMHRAKQDVPLKPTNDVPVSTVVLRAKLILEECLETIRALGVEVKLGDIDIANKNIDLEFNKVSAVDLQEVADGCCDIKVVTTGTLSAFGIPDMAIQQEVDYNNLAKFGPGHSIREDGKLIKPPHHVPPRIEDILCIINDLHDAYMKLEDAQENVNIVHSDSNSITDKWDSVRREVLNYDEDDFVNIDY